MRASVLLLVVAACRAPDPAPGEPSGRPAGPLGPGGRTGTASVVASPRGADDAIVAQVDGRPVWGSCVVAQLARGTRDRAAALGECIDFELLAQVAERRGLVSDREVADQTRRALVSRLVEIGFEQRYRTPDDLRELVDKIVARNRDQLDKPELRASAFVRIEVAKTATPEAERRAHELADRIAGELATERGLFPSHVLDTANRLAAGTGLKVTTADFRAATREALVGQYADALFAIPEVGRIGKPARTEWGWDIILLTQLYPPRVYTPDEVAEKVFPELRRGYFQVWVNQIVRSLGLKIEVDAALAARLDEVAP